MSGGQQQRVAISRSLINSPALVLADEPTGNLDSHTSVEILRMFQQLNAEGMTVVLVTHDPRVAAYAHRMVRIADGVIEGEDAGRRDDGGRPRAAGGPCPRRDFWPGGKANRPPHPQTAPGARFCRPRGGPRWAPCAATRCAGLSALGVIIAVAAVIAMSEIGQGSKAMLQNSIASMGANTIMIFAGSLTTSGVSKGTGTAVTLTPQDAQEIGRQCPAVQCVAPLVRARSQVVDGGHNCVPE